MPANARMGPALVPCARGAAISSILLGVTVLAAWSLNVPDLKTVWPGRPPMPPESALIFILLGAALWLMLPHPAARSNKARHRVGQGIALMAAVLEMATLSQALIGSKAIDLGLLHIHLSAALEALRERPSFAAASSGLALGLGIAALDHRFRGVWLSEVLAVLTMQIALLAVIGHVFRVPELYGSLNYRPESGMAVHTTAGILLLGGGLLCARAERGLMILLRSQTPGGTLARRWALTPAVLLLIMGLVYLASRQHAPSTSTWALLMTSLTFLTAATWATAHVLHRAGLERDEAQRTLEDRVNQRTAELNQAYHALNAAKDELAHVNRDLEKTIQERTGHLKETIRSLEVVCYNIAHDLRAPNRAIAGFAQALLGSHGALLDDTARDCLRRIASAAQRSDALTLDLLAYGRLGHADLPCSRQSLDVHVHTVIEKLASEIEAAQALIEIPGPLPELWANSTALEQVFTNLITNALKFVFAGVRPHVTICTEDAGAYCRVLVQDNGIGIPVEHQQQVFGVFQRLHPLGRYPGTGIGLAIVQKSIERMGGRVGVRSSSGSGSCFWFELLKPERFA
jgi:signal transduction histidine kinase